MELPTVEIPALQNGGTPQHIEIPAGDIACVLIVDDNPAKLTSLAAVVSGMELEVVTATSGREALRQLLQRDFALILLDVRMPTMDGYETAQIIHSRPRSAHIPIIYITAEALTEEERFKGYTVGAVDWILSPIMPEILRAKIKVFVDLFYLNRIALRQAEELKAHNEQLERELKSMAQLSQPPTVAAGKAAPKLPLHEASPDAFGKLVSNYLDLLDHAVERQAYKVVYDISGKLQAMAKEMAAMLAWPRDVVEVHNRALQMKIGSMKPELKWAYIEEGRLMVLELMGYLANSYRK